MQGLMQFHPLMISSAIEFAALYHGDTEVVSRRVEGDIHRSNYATINRRAKQVAQALDALGLAQSARVGTLAWNGYRHFELYYGVSGSGRVLHTLNPRLHPEQLAWIVNHAEDEVLAFDMSFLPLVKAVASKLPTVKHFIALCDAAQLPADSGIPNLQSYEAWLAPHGGDYTWPVFDENLAAGLCYTSGTTGNPKGVLYSHRSSMLHALASAATDVIGICSRDTVLPVVPMFHVNAWGLPYLMPMVGAKVVFPGAALDGKSIYELFESEGVAMSAGVPTVWQMLLAYMDANQLKLSTMKRTVIGGSACPPAMLDAFRDRYGVTVNHAWGMTEMSPLGTFGTLKGTQLHASADAQRTTLLKQGRAVFGVDMKIVDGEGHELPRDGVAAGDLMVRGSWIIEQYYRGEGGSILDADGYFSTGDVATLDADGFMQITDRSKDVIKSGGEWISSIDVENIAMAHPAVAMAACIGVRHPKWDERPMLVVVKKPNVEVSAQDILHFYEGKIAKWQIPDAVQFVDAIPLGATGKMQKTKLREMFKEFTLSA
ncbi:MAG: long-chain-fatty-acid--CoA ligase [Burkholderiales bacterium]|nr:long-chain-fatty-acid--CoA ligase [Burkholderiales bacterium]